MVVGFHLRYQLLIPGGLSEAQSNGQEYSAVSVTAKVSSLQLKSAHRSLKTARCKCHR